MKIEYTNSLGRRVSYQSISEGQVFRDHSGDIGMKTDDIHDGVHVACRLSDGLIWAPDNDELVYPVDGRVVIEGSEGGR